MNVANALSALTFMSEIGLLDPAEAEGRLSLLLDSLTATPRIDGWMQDWHSPSSRMPYASNRIGSMTDLPQLYAALMVVEQSWPTLAADAAALRTGIADLSDLSEPMPDGDCHGMLHWATDQCNGAQPGFLEHYGNDTLLGEFLAVATNGYAILDTLGIPCPGLFDDGFEIGDTSAWSSSTPNRRGSENGSHRLPRASVRCHRKKIARSAPRLPRVRRKTTPASRLPRPNAEVIFRRTPIRLCQIRIPASPFSKGGSRGI